MPGVSKQKPPPAPVLDEAACRRAVAPWPLRFFDEIGSTSDAARAGLSSGDMTAPLAVVADRQTHGRGQRGRVWIDGGVAVTFALPRLAMPPSELPLVAAVLVRRALAPFAPDVRIKWPNDLQRAGDRKLAGLLCERIARHDLVGVGANVVAPSTNIDLAIATLDHASRLDALAAVARSMALLLDAPPRLGDVLDEYRLHDALAGRRVRVSGPQELEGTCRGIDEAGRLLVGNQRITTGTVRAFVNA